ncbi:MAG TPA: serine/threonine-protein kinase [Kofleriaceae bacterium]
MGDTTPELGKSMIGAVLGNYRVIAEISSGGMGTVYRAEHALLGKPAAIKLLKPELTANAELVDRFFTEAKAATAIRHPGIIDVYDYGHTAHGYAYLVMELLDGDPLGKRLEARGRFSEVEAANIARGIASALKAAHGKGIVHRDLKPDNVFLVPDPDGPSERVKVLDFGIAKLASSAEHPNVHHTQTGALMGTPLYMAPEQARAAGTIDHRADLYSLGCILYELLVGAPPFVAEGMGEVIAMQMFADPEPPSARLAEITPEMEELVLKLLEKEPHARYQSAGEVVTALAALGARLSTRLSAPLTSVGDSKPQVRITQLRSSKLEKTQPTRESEPKRASLALVAGGVTVVIAAAVIAIVVLANRDPATVATEPQPAPAPAPVPAPAPISETKLAPAPAPAPTPAPVEVLPAKPEKAPGKDPKRNPGKAPVVDSAGQAPRGDGTPDKVIEVAPRDPKEPKPPKGAVTDKNAPYDTGEEQLELPRTKPQGTP